MDNRIENCAIGRKLRPLPVLFMLLSAFVVLLGLTACGSPGAATPGTSGTVTNATPASNATPAGATANGARLSFKEKEHDFGKLNRNNAPEYRFAFTNTGSAPLTISDIRTEPIDPAS